MKIREVVLAYGHEFVQSTHKTTFEITRDKILTKRGDCIIAVNADKGASDLSDGFKEYARRADATITITIEADKIIETVKAKGDPRLSFTDHEDIVVRRSTYTCGRTVAVSADKAASDFSRNLIEKLKNSDQTVKITFTVETPTI